MNYKTTKTLGPQTSALFVELNERGTTTFGLREVEEITGLRGSSARSLIHKAEKRGLITRLQGGLYTLVPFELGRATEYVGDPYVVAKQLCGGTDYFISYSSAMELHQMLTQPQLTIYVSSTRRKPPRDIRGYEYRFILVQPKHLFGLTQVWTTKQQSVTVSDPERTIVDALRQPQYTGGIPETARALWIGSKRMKVQRLVEYALHLRSGAVFRRLGFLLELYNLASEDELKPLRTKLTATYNRLDPTLPKSGSFFARWRVQLNIDKDELEAIRHT